MNVVFFSRIILDVDLRIEVIALAGISESYLNLLLKKNSTYVFSVYVLKSNVMK